jgi:tripartite-type tricarboxylate transporter receptor subunit TctC
VPTAAEGGLPGLVVTSWHGTPELTERLRSLGVPPAGGTAATFVAFFAGEMERWGQVIREAGVKPE